MVKRVLLFLMVNILVITSISIMINVFNIQPYLSAQGLNYGALMIFCLIWGMVGSMISLFTSKWIAKRAFGVRTLQVSSSNPVDRAILMMVQRASKKAGLSKMPEVGMYDSPEINAFATGATKNSSLVAISTGLIDNMNEDQVEAVIGHEIGHIANGDMVTMALLQGILNSFVMFLSRAIAYIGVLNSGGRTRSFFLYYLIQMAVEIVLMFLGSIVISYFSRKREYRADAYAAKIVGREKMISALQVLQQRFEPIDNHPAYRTMQISAKDSWMSIFATHPKISNRIKALQKKTHL